MAAGGSVERSPTSRCRKVSAIRDGGVPAFARRSGRVRGDLTARLWATYDDGQTWTQVSGEKKVGAGQAATFSLRTPAQTNGFVGYRVVMTDSDGNAIDGA